MDHKFSVQAMVQGYHAYTYQSIWDAACDGELLTMKGN